MPAIALAKAGLPVSRALRLASQETGTTPAARRLWQDPIQPQMSQLRRILSGSIVLLLFLPASETIPTAQWNLHLIQRLRDMKRVSPDIALDLSFRELLQVCQN